MPTETDIFLQLGAFVIGLVAFIVACNLLIRFK